MSQRGSVLIFTLWILVCLSLIALGFGRRARLETHAAAYEMGSLTARMLARSAVELGMAALREDYATDNSYDALNEPWAQEIEVPIEQIVGTTDTGLSTTAMATCTIVDEGRKLNINEASEEMLDNFDLIPSSIVGEIIARRLGEDDEVSGDDYRFTIPEELLEFDRIELEDWIGEPGSSELALRDAITVYGSDKINVNTAPAEVIAAVTGLSENLAEDIVAYRRGMDGRDGTSDDRPFETLDDLAKVRSLNSGDVSTLGRYSIVYSTVFTLTGKAQLYDGRVSTVVQAVVSRNTGAVRAFVWREG